jgi:hypothetical protein
MLFRAMRSDDLASATLDELERIYRETSAPLVVPRGRFRGRHLAWLRTTGSPVWLGPALWLAFARIPFGVDFDHRRWFFLHHAARIGHFLPDIGPSRWRDTRAIRLHYHPSRLPDTIRLLLYDEVKPLTESLCLGIGGINASRGRGEQFFFALERVG